ncbi:FxDxF family PEP-CTERM protein [Roseateles sp. BYS96W]|uniref:FxDxF family PEP-CTERM protein n=1 Tax=Pelomonas nitida TaxID=3299027 RepID=A0ABW7G7D9_9BURK
MKLKSLAAASLVALAATGAQAASITTFAGGQHADVEIGAETGLSGAFFKEYDFTLSGTFDLTATFLSSGVVGSFGIYNADDTPVTGLSWAFGGKPFTTTTSFTLDAGSYYYAVQGGKSGSFSLSSAAVAAVPEPETYALLGAGLGIVGFVASRRRRQD